MGEQQHAFTITVECDNCGNSQKRGCEKRVRVKDKQSGVLVTEVDEDFGQTERLTCDVCGFSDQLSVVERQPV